MKINIDKNAFNNIYWPHLFEYMRPLEIYYGGAGSGKSVFITQKILLKAIQEKRKVLIVRKTLASQRESCWRLFLDTISDWGIYDLCRINKSEYTITLMNGSVLLFKGLDDPEKIKSVAGLTDIWTEEATELTEEDFDQLRLRLRAKKKDLQFFVSFNPVSKSHFLYKRYFSEDKTEEAFILQTTYKDNKFLPESYVKNIEKLIDTNPTYYKIYALGEFCSLSKLVYQNWNTEAFDHRQIDGTLCVGLDFGFVNDKTALIASIVTDEDIYIFKEYTCIGKTNDEIYGAIKALGMHKSVIIADSAEPKSIEELKRLGCIRIRESKKGPDSIIHGIQKIQQKKIHIHPSCIETIAELQNYAWEKDKKSGEYINKPIDDWNHCLDALRYSMQCIDKNKLRTLSKLEVGF